MLMEGEERIQSDGLFDLLGRKREDKLHKASNADVSDVLFHVCTMLACVGSHMTALPQSESVVTLMTLGRVGEELAACMTARSRYYSKHVRPNARLSCSCGWGEQMLPAYRYESWRRSN